MTEPQAKFDARVLDTIRRSGGLDGLALARVHGTRTGKSLLRLETSGAIEYRRGSHYDQKGPQGWYAVAEQQAATR